MACEQLNGRYTDNICGNEYATFLNSTYDKMKRIGWLLKSGLSIDETSVSESTPRRAASASESTPQRAASGHGGDRVDGGGGGLGLSAATIENGAAIAIQRWFKGAIGCRLHTLVQEIRRADLAAAGVVIQRHHRGSTCRRRSDLGLGSFNATTEKTGRQEEYDSVKQMQGCEKETFRHQLQELHPNEETASRVLAKFFSRLIGVMRMMRRRQEKKASLCIQRAFRAHCFRRNEANLFNVQQEARRKNASIVIQRTYRNYYEVNKANGTGICRNYNEERKANGAGMSAQVVRRPIARDAPSHNFNPQPASTYVWTTATLGKNPPVMGHTSLAPKAKEVVAQGKKTGISRPKTAGREMKKPVLHTDVVIAPIVNEEAGARTMLFRSPDPTRRTLVRKRSQQSKFELVPSGNKREEKTPPVMDPSTSIEIGPWGVVDNENDSGVAFSSIPRQTHDGKRWKIELERAQAASHHLHEMVSIGMHDSRLVPKTWNPTSSWSHGNPTSGPTSQTNSPPTMSRRLMSISTPALNSATATTTTKTEYRKMSRTPPTRARILASPKSARLERNTFDVLPRGKVPGGMLSPELGINMSFSSRRNASNDTEGKHSHGARPRTAGHKRATSPSTKLTRPKTAGNHRPTGSDPTMGRRGAVGRERPNTAGQQGRRPHSQNFNRRGRPSSASSGTSRRGQDAEVKGEISAFADQRTFASLSGGNLEFK
jgi:hypothetical protein